MALAFNRRTPEGRGSKRSFDVSSMKPSELRKITKRAGMDLKSHQELTRLARGRSLTKNDMREYLQRQIDASRLDARDAMRAGSQFGLKPSDRHFDSPTVEPKLSRRVEERKKPPVDETRDLLDSSLPTPVDTLH